VSDEEGKTRRNLMVFSTGILAVGILGIPISESTLLGINLKNVSPERAWGCAMVVLVYLTLRYWFDPTFQKQRSIWNKREKEFREKYSTLVIRWSFSHWLAGKWWSPVIFDLPAPPVQRARPALEGYVEFKNELAGSAKLTWTAPANVMNVPGASESVTHAVVYARDDYAKFRIRGLVFLGIGVLTISRMMLVNWLLLEIAVPLGLALAAAGGVTLMVFYPPA
jgi:hypothetical protein